MSERKKPILLWSFNELMREDLSEDDRPFFRINVDPDSIAAFFRDREIFIQAGSSHQAGKTVFDRLPIIAVKMKRKEIDERKTKILVEWKESLEANNGEEA